jgi:hypothetical protein
MEVVKRRLESLKVEGLGFSQAEIVRELTQKNAYSKRTICNDFEAAQLDN